jgi:hypothetical protein
MQNAIALRVIVVLAVCARPTAAAAAAEPVVEFLTAAQAKAAIVDDAAEPFFDRLSAVEMRSRLKIADADQPAADLIKQLKETYQANVLDFTDDERAMLKEVIVGLQPFVENDYPLYAQVPWRLIKSNERVEWGASFTRGPHIVFSSATLARLAREKQGGDARLMRAGGGLLLHEKMHVLQRQRPELLAKLYADVWGFVHAKTIDRGPWLEARRLTNPDAPDVNWVFPVKADGQTNWIWPQVAFAGGGKAGPYSFRDVRMLAVDVEKAADGFAVKAGKDERPSYRDVSQVEQYTATFGTARNAYHPNEAAAEAFAHIVMSQHVLSPEMKERDDVRRQDEALKATKKWFLENLRTPPGR